MLKIRRTGEGYYLASLANQIKELDRTQCHMIKKDLSPVIKPHREITVDIKGVNSIQSGGFKLLQDLLVLANSKRCKIKFINVEPSVSNKIFSLPNKPVRHHEEMDIE